MYHMSTQSVGGSHSAHRSLVNTPCMVFSKIVHSICKARGTVATLSYGTKQVSLCCLYECICNTSTSNLVSLSFTDTTYGIHLGKLFSVLLLVVGCKLLLCLDFLECVAMTRALVPSPKPLEKTFQKMSLGLASLSGSCTLPPMLFGRGQLLDIPQQIWQCPRKACLQ